MASLKFIMDVNDDHPPIKRDKGANKPANANPSHEAPAGPPPNPRHAISPGLATDQDINRAAPAAQTKRRGASSRGLKSVATTSLGIGIGVGVGAETAAPISLSFSSSSPSLSAPTSRQSTRRPSTTSNESMDQTRYGSPPSSSSMGAGPQRPMPMALHPTVPHLPARITPKTGRVSKAQKGLPVHVCGDCSPPKIFTRAEHLRRHKLGHGKPQFQCPGCDRSFHRSDLLARHQQKHDHENDRASKPEPEQQSPHPSPAAMTLQLQQSPRISGPGPAPSSSATDAAPAPNAAIGNQPDFSQIGSPVHGNNSVYGTPGSSSQEFRGAYTLSSAPSVINTTQSLSLTGSYQGGLGEYEPRTAPPPIYVVTQGLQLPNLQPTDLPELHDASPWPSPASDSTYSTPASDISRNPRSWTGAQRLSPYPSTAPQGLQSPGSGPESARTLQAPLFANSYSSSQPSEQSFGGAMLNVPSMGYSTPGPTGHHRHSLSVSSEPAFRHRHHQHSNSISSVRSLTPPLNTSSHQSETLFVSAPTHTGHLDPMAGLDRRKSMMMEAHQDLMSTHTAIATMDMLSGLGVNYGGGSNATSPGGDSANHNSGIVAELDLAMGAACAMPLLSPMTIPLPGPVRAAIPRYLEVYWAKVDQMLPIVHRRLFEAGPEDVLKCAMAAVATQYLDCRDDRTRGNQLHEFAWQEVKRVPQWSLQTMQAILLCEHFARFRGRKAVTRPSKPFESLYSRVLFQNPALLDHAMLSTDQHHLSVQDRWLNWIDAESRRRLSVACLFCDGHAAIYQQQRRAQDCESGAPAVFQLAPLVGRSAKLWEATSAEEWANALAADPGACETEYVPPLERLTPEDVARRPAMDRLTILSLCAQRLPRRQRSPVASVSANNSPSPELDTRTQHAGSQFDNTVPLFSHHPQDLPEPTYLDAEERINTLFRGCPVANTYLALHHTPLRDLLAVGGDSWVFSQKVLPATSFHEHQNRLKQWITASTTTTNNSINTNLSAARATVHAARAILAFLDRARLNTHAPSNPTAPWSTDLSDYWALYVCALVCWAFTHRAPPPQPQQHSQQQQHMRQRSIDGNSPAVSATAPGPSDEEAMGWLQMVAAEGMPLEEVVRLRGRREAGGVVGLVRRLLEADCLGGRSRLYVDTVGVLRKLEEGSGWKWF